MQGSVAACGTGTVDRYQFMVARGQLVEISVDTVDGATAADLCLKGRCGALDIGADDEMPCTAAPPAFACPRTGVTTRRATQCTVDVAACTGACSSASADYVLEVAVDGGGPDVIAIADDAAIVPGVCIGGARDGETCAGPDDCADGSCADLPLAPVRAAGDALPAEDLPEGAEVRCLVQPRMTSSAVYGAIRAKIDYRGGAGGFRGKGRDVACNRNVGGSGSFTDHDASQVLAFSLLNGAGIAGPRTLASCPFFTTARTLDPDDFFVDVVDARSPSGAAIEPGLQLLVTCGGTTTTTTSSTTSTTAP